MMELIILFGLVSIAFVGIHWWPQFRLRHALVQPFPRHYSRILRKNIPAYSHMHADLQLQLKRLVKQFLFEKKFVGCDGLRITDEMRVTVAGKACLLLLNRRAAVYPDLKVVLLYPSAFIVPRTLSLPGGVLTHSNQTLSGESWSDGRVVLAWDHAQKKALDLSPEAQEGHDVVLHEFAHQLDSATGPNNGAPYLPNQNRYQQWSEIFAWEFSTLQYAAEHSLETVLDHYGATNPAEFFAVATEAFYEKSQQLADHHPELFEQLRLFYKVDPRDWR